MHRASLALAVALSALAFACGSTDGEGERGRFDEMSESPSAGADDSSPGEGEAALPPTKSDPGADPSASPGPETAPEPTPAANTCQTARDLGSLIGDSGSGSVSAQGKCSEWLRVRVTETDTWAWANDIKVTATLVSPEGSDFDVAFYYNASSDVPECATPTAKSEQTATQSKVVKLAWGEKYTANGGDDSRTVAIEIKAKDGRCAAEPWTLLLQGNL